MEYLKKAKNHHIFLDLKWSLETLVIIASQRFGFRWDLHSLEIIHLQEEEHDVETCR